MNKKLSKNAGIIATIVFLVLQLVKPPIIITLYKALTNFHPTIMNNYELYFMVWGYIPQGGLKATYATGFILAEILFLAIPFVIYKVLKKCQLAK